MSETATRLRNLLREASEAFDRCENPFSHDWLSARGVMADECIAMSRAVSAAIDLLLSASCIPQHEDWVGECFERVSGLL